jgi:hypothetical protein
MRISSGITNEQLQKKLKKYPPYVQILVEFRVKDELIPVETVRKNKDGDIVLRG